MKKFLLKLFLSEAFLKKLVDPLIPKVAKKLQKDKGLVRDVIYALVDLIKK